MSKRTTLVIFLALFLVAGIALIAPTVPRLAEDAEKQELLIYCGITMVRPITEIGRLIEQEENCKISVMKGGSGNLLRAIEANGVGDLYLPGSESYIKEAQAKGLVTTTRHVGFNKAAMMVPKGNPKRIGADLDILKSKEHYVVIGNPDSGSIGRETKKILSAAGIYEEVATNAREMTTDSKRLSQVLKNGEADVVTNWYATSRWPENREHIDVLAIDQRYAAKKRLVLGLLKTSGHPEIAKKFMAYAGSEQGRAIFERYGLYSVQ